MKVFTKLASAAALCALLGSAQAAICTATSFYTNPDATVTNATSCGVGIVNDQNDDDVDLNSLMVGGLTTWASIAKVNADKPESGTAGLFTTGTSPAGSSGSWAFDDLPAYDTYTLVIKDGGSPGGNAPNSPKPTSASVAGSGTPLPLAPVPPPPPRFAPYSEI